MKSFLSKSKEIDSNNSKTMKKNRSYYQKIYAIQSEDEDEKEDHNKSTLKLIKNQKRKFKMNPLIKVFKGPEKDFKNGPKWPKVTHPKLPFSNVKKEEPDIKKKRIELLRPSRKYHDFHTIQWLRKKYSESVIEKSVFSILPENGKAKIPINESEQKKRKRKMMEFLESFKGPIGKEKFVKINPKYLYNETTYDKIKKLKEIFLEFDGSGYRKMEMNELASLFNQNNIRADTKELVKLFFKDKNIKKEDYAKLYLNFYEFLNFALTKEQDFRQFMRNIKEKYKNEEESKDKNVYLPMNLNLVLDYFINKAKERSSIEKIEKAINEMDMIIKENSLINNNENVQKESFYYDIKNENDKSKNKNNNKHKQKKKNVKSQDNGKVNNSSRRPSNRDIGKVLLHYNGLDGTEAKLSSRSNLKVLKKNENEDIEQKFEKIDFKQLIQEFSNLFNYNGLNEVDNNNNDNEKKLVNNNMKKKNIKNRINSFNKPKRENQEIKSFSSKNLFFPRNQPDIKKMALSSNQINKNNINDIKKSNIPELYELADDEKEVMGDAIKQQMNENTILKMNIKNYEKLHDIKLALDATKEQINQIKKNDNSLRINNMKKSSSQRILPEIKMMNKKENQYSFNNNYKKVDNPNKSKQLTNYKNNSVKIIKRNEQSTINNKSNINCFSENNNNHSRVCKTNWTFLNIFCGKSQLVNMSQDQTDYASKSKLDYVPPEFLYTQKVN